MLIHVLLWMQGPRALRGRRSTANQATPASGTWRLRRSLLPTGREARQRLERVQGMLWQGRELRAGSRSRLLGWVWLLPGC